MGNTMDAQVSDDSRTEISTNNMNSEQKTESTEGTTMSVETAKRLDEIRKEHEITILKIADEARDPANYLDYDYHVATGDPNISLFMARRIGKGHIESNKPCQDYCRTAEVGVYTILTDADGVSACPYSDIGSQLACEATISIITEVINSYNDVEKDVINALTSLMFRERLVLKWIDLIKTKIKEAVKTPENMVEEIKKYASTIIFAVISPNWYVCGNLGDGQVMVFNNMYGIKLRDVKKESPAVRCLVHSTCAREDFIVEAFSRSWFDGILLSTDGMYDFLSNGLDFYRYACQIKSRFTTFLEKPEPLQPFCYMKPNEPLKDISRHPRAIDDCSIVLALDEQTLCKEASDEYEILKGSVDIILPSRWSRSCRQYYVYEKGHDYEVCAIHEDSTLPIPTLQSAIIEKPVKTITDNSNESKCHTRYCFYPLNSIESPTLEYLFTHGELRQKGSFSHDSLDILELFSKYQALKKELKSYGLMLNGAAHFLLTYKDGCLYVKKEAICQAREPAPMTIADNYFSALIGALVCGNKKIALFDPGFLTEGRVIKKNEFDESADRQQMFCRIRNTDRHKVNPYILVNYSNTVWTLIDGSKVNYTEGVALQGNLQFCVGDQFVEHGTVYRYMPKEEL